MSRSGLEPTSSTSAPALFRDIRALRSKFMPVLTMGQGSFLSACGLAPESKAFFEDAPLRVGDLIHCETVSRPLHYSVGFNSNLFGNFGGYVLNAINNHLSSIGLVSLLFLFSRPSTIFWRIISVIVSPIKRMAFWSFTHVGNKIIKPDCKRKQPSCAYLNPSAAIVLILNIVLAVTSLFHPKPGSVQRVRSLKGHIVHHKFMFQSLSVTEMVTGG